MSFAIKEAIKAKNKDEVPIGAIIVDGCGNVIAKAHNLVETRNDPTCHAEKLVIEKALKITGQRFLNDCDIWVTLEPCVMCSHIISKFKIGILYFGAYDTKKGSIENGERIFSNLKGIYIPEIFGGIAAKESTDLLNSFFLELRKKS